MGNILTLPCKASFAAVDETGTKLILPCDVGDVSDDSHSFTELYEHRNLLFLALLSLIDNSWYSELHSDGTSYDDWFIAGVELNSGEQITYHLPNKHLKLAAVNLTHLERAPEWDGHTSADVLERLATWIATC